jgi:hypothetical protein
VITSCGKDDIEILIQKEYVRDTINTRDTINIRDTIYLRDTVYIIDTTKKIAINEIIYLEDKFMVVGTIDWQGVAYGGKGRYMAVGSGGNIAISTDNGASWSTKTVGTYT